MEDFRNDLLQKIEVAMVSLLDEEQIKYLDRVLVTILDDYEVSKKCTDIVVYDDSNDEALQYFAQLLKLNGKSDGTTRQYIDATRKALETIGKPYKDVSVFDLRKYFALLMTKVKDVTYNNYITYVNQFFSWLSDDGYIQGNPMKKILHIKEEQKLKKSFTDAEMDCLRDNTTNIRDRALLEFLYSTGMRVGEVPYVNMADIKDNEIVIYGEKSKKERCVYLSDSCLYYLDLYLQERTDDNPALFVANTPRKGKYERLKADGIRRMMKNLGKKCNIEKVHPHRMRRTLASNMVARGADIVTVKEILGHSNIATTQVYIDNSKLNIKYKHKIAA